MAEGILTVWGKEVSDINVEGPPVPIPNTEVKLNCAEDTRTEASRENRSLMTQSILRGMPIREISWCF